jgi:nicotinamide riboside kinase
MKLIAFSGTHCSGKTSLAKALVKHLEDIGRKAKFVDEVVRRCPYHVNENGSYLAQKWIIEEELREYNLAMEGDFNFIIFDRAVYDHLSYVIWLFLRNKLSFQELRKLFKLVENANPHYDKIFYLEPLPLVGDGLRSESKTYQREIDEILRHFLNVNRIETIHIQNCDLDKRLKIVLQHLRDWLI